ncbi:cytochrome bd-I ubiquinol oxidase subunit 1 apoprotein [Sphingobium sp. AP50]|uniref:cytochrome ubiquinol oxidase subunit I n=1 Tax=Sphingobium sp. AP50 TaxID=1884369 RepID=UPI0008C6B74B|nr:cytochrome ubiquinol oxidase subunit I [Sphingobium sp. AP50]SEJ81598.1 cytochrome bd-I ubiquinol oxidase subunit 1 apoprotein [Sphingobium sp. AP50]
MDQLLLSRLQFAFTIGYHILWPAFTIGLAWFVVVLNGAWLRTRRDVYRQLMRFWIRIFALAFGMGVVTGVVISYQLGLNWSGYAKATADVLGPLFVLEVLTAFFLEAGFIGIMLFGQERVGERIHFAACVIVATGTVISAFWIISANSWMHTPVHYQIEEGGRFVATDFWGVVFNPSMPYRFAHMIMASFVTGAFVVTGVSAFWIWRGRESEAAPARTAFSLSLGLLAVLVPLQIFIGDQHGLNTREHQPAKIAAIEARWETARRVPITAIAWPDEQAETNRYSIEIPVIGSLILTHELDGEVRGLKDFPKNQRPPVVPVFFAFRIMVGCGLALLAISWTALFLRWRGKLFNQRWFLLAAMAATPLGFVATLAGWTVTEVGRQPYVIYGQLRTADAVSPVAAGAVASSLVIALVLYNLLLLGFWWFAGRLVWRGPATDKPLPPVTRPVAAKAIAPVLSPTPAGDPS